MSDRPLIDATADLRLSDTKFNRDLAAARRSLLAEIKKIESQAQVEVGVKVDLGNLRRQVAQELAAIGRTGTATIPVAADTTKAKADAQKARAEIAGAGTIIPVGADTTKARAEFVKLQRSLSAFDQVQLQIDVRANEVDEARAAVQRLAVLARSVENDNIIIDADLRDAGVRAELGRISTLVAGLSGQPADIQIDLDAVEALSQLGAVAAAVEALDGRDIDLSVDVNGLGQASAELAALDAAGEKSAASGGLFRLGRALAFIGVGGVAALGAAGAAVTVLGVQSSAALEGTIKSFENILGSAQAADDLFSELQEFAIPSPFDTQVLATTARQLLAIGVATEDVVPTVKDLGAIVALLGNSSPEAFGRLTLALGQIRTSVKPLTQDLRQITSTIPGFNTEIQLAEGVAAQFGVSFAEAQDKIKDGAITGEEAVDILLKRMQDFPGVAGSIEAAAETLQGRLSAFGDTVKLNLIDSFAGVSTIVGDSLEPLGESVDVALKEIGPALAGSFESLLPQLLAQVEPLGVALAPAFAGLFEGVGLAVEGIAPAVAELLPVLGELLPQIGRVIGEVAPVVGETAAVLADALIPALDILADVLDAIPTPVLTALVSAFIAFKATTGVASVLGGVATGLQKIGATGPGAATGVRGVIDSLSTLNKVAGVAGIATGAAFAGIGLASEDATTQATSALSAVGTVAAGFAVGGPVGGAIATGAVLIGSLIGRSRRAAEEAKELAERTEEVAGAMSDLTVELLDNKDRLDEVTTAADAAALAYETLGASLLTGEEGEENAKALVALGESASGATGATNLIKVLSDIGKDGDLANSKVVIDSLAESFEGLDPELADEFLLALQEADGDGAKVFDDLLGSIENARYAIAQGIPGAEDSLGAKLLGLTPDQLAAIEADAIAIGTLFQEAVNFDGVDTFSQFFTDTAVASERFRVALEASEEETGIQRTSQDLKQLEILFDDVFKRFTLRRDELNDSIRQNAFEELELTEQQRLAYANLAYQLRVPAYQLVELDVEGFDLADEELKEIQEELDAIEADEAAAQLDLLKDASDELAETLEQAGLNLDGFQSKLSDVGSAQDFRASLGSIGDDLREVINQDELDDVAKFTEDIADQRREIADLVEDVARERQSSEREAQDIQRRIARGQQDSDREIRDLQKRLERGKEDAAAETLSLEQRIAAADAAGATQGAAGLRQELERLKQDAADEQGDLETQLQRVFEDASSNQEELEARLAEVYANADEAVEKLGEARLELVALEAQVSGLATLPITLAQTLREQADSAGLSLFDLLILGPTEESAAAYQEQFAPVLNDAIQQVADAYDKDGAQAAIDKAIDLDGMLRRAYAESGELTQSEINDLLDFGFNLDDILPTLDDALSAEGKQAFLDTILDAFADMPEPPDILIGADTLPFQTGVDLLLAEYDNKEVVVPVRFQTAEGENGIILPSGQIISEAQPDRQRIRGIGEADGGIVDFFRDGGLSNVRDAAHIAQIVPVSTWRVHAEPETGGEGYIPLSPLKRVRSTQVLTRIADMFDLDVTPRGQPEVPKQLELVGASPSTMGSAAISAAVEAGVRSAMKGSPARTTQRDQLSGRIGDVKIEVTEKSPKRTAKRIRRELADMAAFGYFDEGSF